MKHEKHRPARSKIAAAVAQGLQDPHDTVSLTPAQVRLFRDPLYGAQMLWKLRERVQRHLGHPVEVVPSYRKKLFRGTVLTGLTVRRLPPPNTPA